MLRHCLTSIEQFFHPSRRLRRDDIRLMRPLILKRLGVNLVFDLGANVGQYGLQLRQFGYQGRIVSAEPQSRAYARLQAAARDDPRWTCLQCAVGSSECMLTMNLTTDDKCSSLLKPTNELQRRLPKATICGAEQVCLRTLDSICQEHARDDDACYIKIDVQGYEAEVLKGGQQCLARAKAVEVELSLIDCYDKAPRFFEVVSHLHEHDFNLVYTARVCADYQTGRLLQIDGIFER